MSTGIDTKYQQLGGANGVLGAPVTDEIEVIPPSACLSNPYKGLIRYYQHGMIFCYEDLVSFGICDAVYGPIYEKWQSLKNEGIYYGLPCRGNDAEIVKGSDQTGDQYECAMFEEGWICHGSPCGTHGVHNNIASKWREKLAILGYPEITTRTAPDGVGRYNHFQGGSIYWHPSTGAYETHGSIRAKWANLGWERSFMGYPVTDELVVNNAGARVSHFQNASVYYSPDTGTYEIHGSIRKKWQDLDQVGLWLGLPTTDETPTPDGVGRYNHFQNGSIYWHPNTGAHEVHGSIRARWSELGWERSYLGYPITDESPSNSGNRRYNLFQGGCVHWSPDSGSIDLALGLRQPFKSLSPAIRERKVLTILWDPQIPDCPPAISKDAVVSAIFGETNSVRSIFRENSGGAFKLENAGVLGWYPADKPAEHYWNHPAGSDEWISGHAEKWTEAIRKADKEFDFRAFDIAPRDETTHSSELGVLIVIASKGTAGFVRPVWGRELPSRQPLIVDGVRIPQMAEVYTSSGSPPDVQTAAHELMHLLFDMGDMYFTWFMPFAAGAYSLMDGGIHLDPFHKLKLGWVRPQMITQTGRFTLPDVETKNTIWLLVDPRRGIDEYFLVENRWPGNSYEKNLPDRGLAVWHIIEDPAVYGNLPAPPGVSQADWNSVPKDEFSRRGIRMIRPVIGPPFDDRTALWDGSDPLTGYALTSHDPDPTHARLHWANGSPSGFAIREISAPGPEMSARIEVPW